MRFSIRDLLWLTAVVALAATVWTERTLRRRQAQQWQTEKAAIQQESAARLSAMQANVNRLRGEIAILRHEAVVEMEERRQRESQKSSRQQFAAQAAQKRPVKLPRPVLPNEDEN
jgi:TolA-binding protein